MSGVALVGVVEAVVGLGQALVVPDHERGAELVIGLAGGFEGGVGLPVLGEGKGLEAVGGRVAEVVLHRRPKNRAQISWGRDWRSAEGGVGVRREDIQRVREDHGRWQERERHVRAAPASSPALVPGRRSPRIARVAVCELPPPLLHAAHCPVVFEVRSGLHPLPTIAIDQATRSASAPLVSPKLMTYR